MAGKLKYKNGTRSEKNEVVCLILVLIVVVSAVIGGLIYFIGANRPLKTRDPNAGSAVGGEVFGAIFLVGVVAPYIVLIIMAVTFFAMISLNTALPCIVIALTELGKKETVRKKVFIITAAISLVCLAFDAFLLYNTAVPLYGSVIKAALKIK